MESRKSLLCFALAAGVLLVFADCASTRTLLPTEGIDEIRGTWVNPEYDGTYSGKVVITPERSIVWYRFIKSETPLGSESLEVDEKWADSRGAVYFMLHAKSDLHDMMLLVKVGPDMMSMEMLGATRRELLPAAMKPDAPYCTYHIWYRP